VLPSEHVEGKGYPDGKSSHRHITVASWHSRRSVFGGHPTKLSEGMSISTAQLAPKD
jgi:hypothetical protein